MPFKGIINVPPYFCPFLVILQKLALRESNISRYREEFHEVCVVGSGTFGTVYKCINRLDGCAYALKRSHKPVAGSADE